MWSPPGVRNTTMGSPCGPSPSSWRPEMAQTPACEIHSDVEAAYIIGDVQTGAQLFLCADCAAHFGLTLALQRLDPAEIANAAQAVGATPPQDGQPEAPANKPARKRRPKAAKPEPAAEPEPRLPEVPAA